MAFIGNTEDLYAGAGGILAPGGVAQVAVDSRVVTRRATERIIRLAFETGMKPDRGRADGVRRVTCVVKDNILHGCRLFVSIFEELGEQYPQVEREVTLVDVFTQWLALLAGALRRGGSVEQVSGDIITELGVGVAGDGVSVGCISATSTACSNRSTGRRPNMSAGTG